MCSTALQDGHGGPILKMHKSRLLVGSEVIPNFPIHRGRLNTGWGNFPGGPGAKTVLPMQGAWTGSLVVNSARGPRSNKILSPLLKRYWVDLIMESARALSGDNTSLAFSHAFKLTVTSNSLQH